MTQTWLEWAYRAEDVRRGLGRRCKEGEELRERLRGMPVRHLQERLDRIKKGDELRERLRGVPANAVLTQRTETEQGHFGPGKPEAGPYTLNLLKSSEGWSLKNRELLEEWFTSTVVAEEYVKASEAHMSRRESIEDGWRVWSLALTSLDGQLNYLRWLNDGLHMYERRPAGRVMEPTEPPASLTHHTTIYNINAPVGQLNAGERQTVENIKSHIEAVARRGNQQVAEAIRAISEAAIADEKLDDRTRGEVLDMIEDFAEAAKAPREHPKAGRMKGAIAGIAAAALAETKLGEAWQEWQSVITQYLRVL